MLVRPCISYPLPDPAADHLLHAGTPGNGGGRPDELKPRKTMKEIKRSRKKSGNVKKMLKTGGNKFRSSRHRSSHNASATTTLRVKGSACEFGRSAVLFIYQGCSKRLLRD